jgi:hypothetical protein
LKIWFHPPPHPLSSVLLNIASDSPNGARFTQKPICILYRVFPLYMNPRLLRLHPVEMKVKAGEENQGLEL